MISPCLSGLDLWCLLLTRNSQVQWERLNKESAYVLPG